MKVLTPTGAPKVQRQDFIPYIPRVRAYNGAVPALANAAWTTIPMSAEDFDTDLMHDLVTNTSRITAKTPGVYFFTAGQGWGAGGAGTRAIRFLKNGVSVSSNESGAGAGVNAVGFGPSHSEIIEMGAGDYVELQAYQDTGGVLNQGSFFIAATYIGPGFQTTRYAKQVFYVTPAQFASLSPIDGDEAYITVDAANSVIWHMRYNAGSSSAFKWEFLGGGPALSMNDNQEGGLSAGVYGDPTTPGPSFTVPRGGDFIVASGYWANVSSGPSNYGAIAKNNVETGNRNYYYGVAPNVLQSVAREDRLTNCAAGDVLKMRWSVVSAGSSVGGRWMSVIPVRIS